MRGGKLKHSAEALDVVMDLKELIMDRRVRNGRLVKDRIKPLLTKLRGPIKARDISRDEIATKPAQVLKISRSEIVSDYNARLWIFLL